MVRAPYVKVDTKGCVLGEDVASGNLLLQSPELKRDVTYRILVRQARGGHPVSKFHAPTSPRRVPGVTVMFRELVSGKAAQTQPKMVIEPLRIQSSGSSPPMLLLVNAGLDHLLKSMKLTSTS